MQIIYGNVVTDDRTMTLVC